MSSTEYAVDAETALARGRPAGQRRETGRTDRARICLVRRQHESPSPGAKRRGWCRTGPPRPDEYERQTGGKRCQRGAGAGVADDEVAPGQERREQQPPLDMHSRGTSPSVAGSFNVLTVARNFTAPRRGLARDLGPGRQVARVFSSYGVSTR